MICFTPIFTLLLWSGNEPQYLKMPQKYRWEQKPGLQISKEILFGEELDITKNVKQAAL